MDNQRRRRNILVLMVLCGEAFPAVKLPQFKHFATQGPFAVSPHVSGLFEKTVPDQRQRLKELAAAQKVVNAVFPRGYHQWKPELKLFTLCQIVKRVVGDGWNASRLTEIEAAFVYRLYQMADALTMVMPGEHVLAFVMEAPDKLRKEGLFVPD